MLVCNLQENALDEPYLVHATLGSHELRRELCGNGRRLLVRGVCQAIADPNLERFSQELGQYGCLPGPSAQGRRWLLQNLAKGQKSQ